MFGAAVLWGTIGPAQVLADISADPFALGSARLLLGGVALALFALPSLMRNHRAAVAARARGADAHNASFMTSLAALIRPGVRGWVLGVSAVTALFQVSFLAAVDRTGAALTTTVALGTTPVVVGLVAYWLVGEWLTLLWGVGTAAAVAGCGLLLLPGRAAGVDPLGVLLGCVAGTAYGGYTAMTKRLQARGVDMTAVMIATLLVGGALLGPWLMLRAETLASTRGLLLTLWLGLATSALAYLLFPVIWVGIDAGQCRGGGHRQSR